MKTISLKDLKKNLCSHRECITSILYFEKPIHRLVSSSLDGNIIIADVETGRALEIINNPQTCHLIRWSSETFLSCDECNDVKYWRVIPPNVKPPIVITSHLKGAVRMMKIDENRFLVAVNAGKICICNFKKKKIEKKLSFLQPKYNIDWKIKLVPSCNFENCFYSNYDNSAVDGHIFLVDYDEDKIHRKLTRQIHKDNNEIRTMDVWVDSKGDELLFFGGRGRRITIFNMGKSVHDDESKRVFCLQLEGLFASSISCSQTLGTRYILMGFGSGDLSLFDTKNQVVMECWLDGEKSNNIHNRWLYQFQAVEIDRTSVKIIAADEGGKISLFSISGLCDLGSENDKQIKIDLEERYEYLKNSFCELGSLLFKISLKNMNFEVLKILII